MDDIEQIYKELPEFSQEEIKRYVDTAEKEEATKKNWDALNLDQKIAILRHTLNKAKASPNVYEKPEEVGTEIKEKEDKLTIGKNGLVQSIGISVFACLILFVVIGMQFVSRTDFTKNIQGMNETLNKAVAGVNDTKTALNTQISSIPGMITNQTSGMSNQINQVSQQVTSINTDLSTKINNISNTQSTTAQSLEALKGTINTEISDVSKSITSNITPQLTMLANTIQALQTQVNTLATLQATDASNIKTLQSQQNNTNITVSSSTTNVSLTNAIASTIPVSISNSGSGQATVTIKLVLTTSTAGIVVADAAMSRTSSRVITSPNITFTTEVIVEGNSTITINPNVVLSYTGTSPNVWNVAWSKN